MNKNKKVLCLASAALLLTAGVSAGRAMAYFTTYTSAGGGAQIDLGFTTAEPPGETFSEWTKHITIQNAEGGRECFVRVKVFAGAKYQDGLQYSDASGRWSPGADGYYYYSEVLTPGASADPLDVRITGVSEEEREDFNVIVVQEHSMVFYDEAGNPVYDWTVTADDGEVQE
ncbi:MAG: hypothetical protein HFI92_04415 [Lachnospiraceae bacterium]|nr:hypothetical protein [Lachnospiraceae bacterium]